MVKEEKMIEIRICRKCNIEKPITDFEVRKDKKYVSKLGRVGEITTSYRHRCKQCATTYRRNWARNYYNTNPAYRDRRAARTRKWCQENREKRRISSRNYQREYIKRPYVKEIRKQYAKKNYEKRKIYFKEYMMRPEVKDRHKEYIKEYFKNNKEFINARVRKYHKEQMKTNPTFGLLRRIKSSIHTKLKKYKIDKKDRSINYIGCTIEELKRHLEKKFKPGMTWTNNTTHGWHIDHIIPVKYFAKNFDFTDIEVQKKCWHYTNLQPLWAHENRTKSGKIGVSNG
tara:strand:- start:67 stop:921 length:855 start_codon:yes stop_codon:yes gene_type:complete